MTPKTAGGYRVNLLPRRLLAVIGNFVVRAQGAGNPPDWVTYAPLPPLALLLLTGLYLFVQPYLRQPAARRAPGAPV